MFLRESFFFHPIFLLYWIRISYTWRMRHIPNCTTSIHITEKGQLKLTGCDIGSLDFLRNEPSEVESRYSLAKGVRFGDQWVRFWFANIPFTSTNFTGVNSWVSAKCSFFICLRLAGLSQWKTAIFTLLALKASGV